VEQQQSTDQLLHQAVAHLQLIRKYTAWIAFVVVVTFALSVIGVIYVAIEAANEPSTADFCAEFPGLC
jgi:hypothetical protein